MEQHDTSLLAAVVGLAVLLGQILAMAVKAIIPRRDERPHLRAPSELDAGVRPELERIRTEIEATRGELRGMREDLEDERRRRWRSLEEHTRP